ncbi:hypothetical protein ACHAW6_007028 [Cyclotella cf. meneghiniana]
MNDIIIMDATNCQNPTTSCNVDTKQIPHRCAHPTPYLILTNIQKKQNIKNILLSSAAFGVTLVFVVGQKKFDFDADSPSTDIPPALVDYILRGRMKIVRLESLEEAVDRIKGMYCCEEMRQRAEQKHQHCQSHGNDNSQTSNCSDGIIPIIGIEIDPTSISLEQQAFPTSTAFMMGNEGQGMTTKQMACCDGFLRIEQYGGGTASLNVSVAVGVVLHRFFSKVLINVDRV